MVSDQIIHRKKGKYPGGWGVGSVLYACPNAFVIPSSVQPFSTKTCSISSSRASCLRASSIYNTKSSEAIVSIKIAKSDMLKVMADPGYKSLLSYKLVNIAFLLGWEFVPLYYTKHEDGRQRDQIKQALRSDKQNIVEGSSERSLSSKLKLYDVAKSSGMEALEDFEDILKFENLPRWQKDDFRLKKLRRLFEGYPTSHPSYPSGPSLPSLSLLKKELGGVEGREGLEAVVNYIIDLLVRSGYLLDKQINAVEEKHKREGGYQENLLKKRLAYRRGR